MVAIDYFSGVEYQPLSAGDLFSSPLEKNARAAVDDHGALDRQYNELWANGDHRRKISDAVELITKSPWHSGMPLMGCLEEYPKPSWPENSTSYIQLTPARAQKPGRPVPFSITCFWMMPQKVRTFWKSDRIG